jgi:hypothetical protein
MEFRRRGWLSALGQEVVLECIGVWWLFAVSTETGLNGGGGIMLLSQASYSTAAASRLRQP